MPAAQRKTTAQPRAKVRATPRTAIRGKRYRIRWRDWTLTIKATPDYLAEGQTHLEVIVDKPAGAPIPLTETGYRSHFMPTELLADNGGAVAFVTAWLEREAKSKAWSRTEAQWRQLEMELVMPQPPKPKRTAPKAAPAKAAKARPR